MNILAYSGFINALLVFLTGVFVYVNNRKKEVSRVFLFFCLFLAIWQLGYGFWQAPGNGHKNFWLIKIITIASTLSSVLFLHLILVFLNLESYKEKFLKWLYFLSFLFLLPVFTPFYIQGAYEYSFSSWPKAGIGATLNIIWGLLIAGTTFFLLVRSHDQQEEEKSKQIAYFLLAFGILSVAGLFNLPQWYGIPLYPYGNLLIFLYPLVIAFAIIKYHLFRVRVILTEILVGIMGLVLFTLPFSMPNTTLRLLTIFIFLLFLVFGTSLIKSTHEEIERREEMEGLAQKLTKAYQNIETLSQMKTEFLKVVNHQLRTPVSIIKGLSSMLAEGEIPQEKQPEYIQKLYVASERLSTILDDILTAQKLMGNPTDVDLSPYHMEDIMDEIVNHFRNLAGKEGIDLVFEKPERELPLALLDKQKIGRIISRLIDNAILYTPSSASRKKVIVSLDLKKKKEGNFFDIQVKDFGIGLSKEDKENLFTLFYRGDEAVSTHPNGSGLGLFIVKKLVSIHRGKIDVESEGRGKGTTFSLLIPCVSAI